jgi:quercetin dioxygenase-like cupin family protein
MSITKELKLSKIFTIVSACAILSCMFNSAALAQVVEPDEHDFMVAGPEDILPQDETGWVYVYGHPSEPGLYVVQITWAPGQGSRPHYHDQARYINVLKGNWWVATGPESDIYDPDNTIMVEEGTFIFEPPYGHHYDMAKDEEVIVQIMGIGPVETTFLP